MLFSELGVFDYRFTGTTCINKGLLVSCDNRRTSSRVFYRATEFRASECRTCESIRVPAPVASGATLPSYARVKHENFDEAVNSS